MEQKITRRVFLKGAAMGALAVSASALLSGCGGDAPLTASATGLNDFAEVQGVRMTIRKMSYIEDENGTFYLMPDVLIKNNSSANIPLYPEQGSFLLRVNGSTNLTLNKNTMALLKNYEGMNALRSLTLSNGGRQESGFLCGMDTEGKVSKIDYAEVFFYPNPKDTRSYLCCRVNKKELTEAVAAASSAAD